jgi:hypothetical protein
MGNRNAPQRRSHCLSAVVLSCVIACAAVGCGHTRVVIPPCPVPTEMAIDDLLAVERWAPALEIYVAEIERYCDAIEELR